ncbi:beta strand repeat-containing protein, partial [Quadrisphaera oryzae]|uniref:beta strand repeat-containing protein n=1 Tax=Quadrisphaera TaxID=317661 RepID=UPI00164775EF
WDATNVWLKDKSAALTGKGFVFGGKAAVSDGQVTSAQSAAQTAAVAAGMVVTAVSNSGFSYADAASQSAKKVSYKSTDKYMVSGTAATQGAFVAVLSVGATVSIATNADGSVSYSATPVPTTGYSSGMIGAYNTAAGTTTLSVVEPITGQALPFLSATATSYNYTTGGAYVAYTVDGQNVSQGIFEGALSLGDSITVKGTGADLNNIRTVALTSGSLSGTVAAVTPGSGANAGAVTAFTIKTTAGAVLGPVTPAAGDTVSIDGTASTQAALVGSGAVGASTASPVSVGDQVTFSKAGGVQKFALVNSAPSKLSGVVADRVTIAGTTTLLSAGTGLTYWSPAGTPTLVNYSNGIRYVIDGTIASQTDFVAAATPGDYVVYQPADTTTNTAASLTLTSKPLTGTININDVNSATHKVSVADSDGDTVATLLDYSVVTSVFAAGTGSTVYTIDGTTATLAQFDAMVNRVQTGARQGSVQVSISNGTVTWALATTNFSAAPAIVSLTKNSSGELVVTFNKAITRAGSAAVGDWTVTGAGFTAAGSPAISWNANGTVATFTGSTVGTGAVNVVPANAAKAALYTDTYGSTVGTSSISATF